MSSESRSAEAADVHAVRLMTLGWVVKRALLGFFLVMLAMGSVAWLTYASMEPATDQSESEQTPIKTAGKR